MIIYFLSCYCLSKQGLLAEMGKGVLLHIAMRILSFLVTEDDRCDNQRHR